MQEEEGGDPSDKVQVSEEDGNLIDLNLGITQFEKVPEEDGLSTQGQGLRTGLGLLTQSSEPFNLGPLIEGTMQRHGYRKTKKGREDNDGCPGEERIPPTLELCSLTYGGGGKKARRHQMLTVDLLQEV